VILFYLHPTPIPAKVALFLEEAGLPFEMVPVDTSKGEQHLPTFRAINPNGKVPAIVDTEGPGGEEARVFDSTAILLYLTEKSDKFLGTPEDRPGCCPGCCSSPPGWVRSPARPCISNLRLQPGWDTPSTATVAKPSVTTRC
jgi:hypothetical protein